MNMKGIQKVLLLTVLIYGSSVTGSEVYEAKFEGDLQGAVRIEDKNIDLYIITQDKSSTYKSIFYKTKCDDTDHPSSSIQESYLKNSDNGTLTTNMPVDGVETSEIKSVSIEKCVPVASIGEKSEKSTEMCEEVACADTTCLSCTDWVIVILIIAGSILLLIVLVACIVVCCCQRKRKKRELLVGDISPTTTYKTDPSEDSCRKSPNMYDSALSIPFIDASLPPTPKIGRTLNGLDILLGNDTQSLNSSDVQ